MTDSEFTQQLDDWLDDVRAEALRLHALKGADEMALKIATQIADSRLLERVRSRQVATARVWPAPPVGGLSRS
jgi:hypothetical protein